MLLRFYNTATRKLDDFRPLDPPKVGIYSCGPTVYWNQHIGHMYAYVQWDVLVRCLRYLGYETRWVMNITDVGHLTSDQDTGEDKMEKGAKREGLTVWEIADKYIRQFTDSLDLLNIHHPDVLCRATAHIGEQIGLIKKMEEHGFTYRTGTGIVFDTSKFPNYPKFARLDLEKQEAGARVEVDKDKKNPWDFLLWVTNQPQHLMQWDSPWGRGFPGWHVECTAMAAKYLGERFDIHTGGKEHIPVHHTNEIAQAYGAFGHPAVNYWLHNEWLQVKGEKMSKSLGNFYTVQDLVSKGYDPLALRYLVLNSHYRTGLNFSFEALAGAQKALGRLRERIQRYEDTKILKEEESVGGVLGRSDLSEGPTFKKKWEKKFEDALDDNLNAPRALGVVWELVEDEKVSPAEKRELLLRWDGVLGLKLGEPRVEVGIPVPLEVEKIVQEREAARKVGDFAKADALRYSVEKRGFVIEDTSQGPKVTKA